ncbi:MAG: UbiD family decarboxylase domain-containing protein [Pseudooceanicola sp.]
MRENDRAIETSRRPPNTDRNRPCDLRQYLEANADIVTRIERPVHLDQIGALSAQSETPIVFENIVDHPGYRLCDMFMRTRATQARALNVSPEAFLPTLAARLRQPPRGLVDVVTGPVKEVILIGDQVAEARLPIPTHTGRDDGPYVTAMNIVRDPETGFYNSSQAGTLALTPRVWRPSFSTPHTNAIIEKYRARGLKEMPMAQVIGVPPAYEIMANYSGLHMDVWGEMEMVGTLLGEDVEMVRCETIDLTVPAHAEIVIEGVVRIDERIDTGEITGASMYHLPKYDYLPAFEVTAITMRADKPYYRNHQTTPQTDHQTLSRLCHEAMLFNRLTEMGIKVTEVRFPPWGGAISVMAQVDLPRPGFGNDALMAMMGAPWFNTKQVVLLSPDTDIEDAEEVYHAIATRCDPARDMLIVPNTRGSLYDPAAEPLPDHYPFRLSGKLGIDATRKSRHDPKDFDRAWPKHWGEIRLKDFL